MKAACQGNGTEQVLSKSEGGWKRRKPIDGISTRNALKTRQPAPHTVPTHLTPAFRANSLHQLSSLQLFTHPTGWPGHIVCLFFKISSLTRGKTILWTVDSLSYSKYIKELVVLLICLSSCHSKENNHFCLIY